MDFSKDLAMLLNMLSSISFAWGPFFFSLLFMLVITKKSHTCLQEIVKRTDPPAEEDERAIYKQYFKASMISGIVLVFISVGWWIFAQMKLHAFEGVIVGLKTNQIIAANEDDVYLRAVQRDAGAGKQIRDYHFAVIRDSPFSKGQIFRFSFYPEPETGYIGDSPPDPVILEVPYSGKLSDKYMLSKEGSLYTIKCLSERDYGK